jgi:hypothetical protein
MLDCLFRRCCCCQGGGDRLRRKLAAQANAYAFALQLEIGEPVLCDQLDKLAQLIDVEQGFGPALLLLLRLVATTPAITRATIRALFPVRLRRTFFIRLLRLLVAHYFSAPSRLTCLKPAPVPAPFIEQSEEPQLFPYICRR